MSNTSTYGTLSEFLMQAGTEYFVIDVSRTRQIIDNQRLFDYELNKMPFATPRQGHAWLCVVFWNKKLSQEHYIWFLKLPLDEQALLVQAARDQFLQIVVTALGSELEEMEKTDAELPENPFVFTPNQQMLADCNALIRRYLNLPERKSLKRAQDYLQAPSVQNWGDLAVQDISDLAVNIHKKDIRMAFERNLEILPKAVNVCLLSTLEGVSLKASSIETILTYHERCDDELRPMLLRALASSQTEQTETYIQNLLGSEKVLDVETLVVIAGRHWQILIPGENSDADYLQQYFEKVIQADPSHALFNGVFADLVQVPALRTFVLAMLRSNSQSAALSKAIAGLFAQQSA